MTLESDGQVNKSIKIKAPLLTSYVTLAMLVHFPDLSGSTTKWDNGTYFMACKNLVMCAKMYDGFSMLPGRHSCYC